MNTIKPLVLYNLVEYRHPVYNNLLCKANGEGHIEIYDKKTRTTVYTGPSRKHNDIGPKGVDFQAMSRDVRCPSCSRLLCRGLGMGLGIQIKCTHCKETHNFRMKELYDVTFATLPLQIQKKLYNDIKNLTF